MSQADKEAKDVETKDADMEHEVKKDVKKEEKHITAPGTASVSSSGDGSPPTDLLQGFALQGERLAAVESLAQQTLELLRSGAAAAAATRAEERLGCLEKKSIALCTQLDDLTRFMFDLAGDHEVLEARTGDQLADLEIRRQRLSLRLNTSLTQGAGPSAASDPVASATGNSVGDNTELLKSAAEAAAAADAAAAAATQAEKRIGCLEKKSNALGTQLDDLTRFMFDLAGDHEVLEARTGDQLADLEVRRQRLSLRLDTSLTQAVKPSAASDAVASTTGNSVGDNTGLLNEIRDEIESFRTGLSSVRSQIDELSQATMWLTSDHEVLEARTGEQIESLEQGRRRLSMHMKALSWQEASAADSAKEKESLPEQMQTQLRQELQEQAESLRQQLTLEQQARDTHADTHQKSMKDMEEKLRMDLQKVSDEHLKSHEDMQKKLEATHDHHAEKHAQNAKALEEGISGALDTVHKKLQEELALLKSGVDNDHGSLREVLMEVSKQVDIIDQTVEKEQKARLSVEEKLDKSCNELRKEIGDALKANGREDGISDAFDSSHREIKEELALLKQGVDAGHGNLRDILTEVTKKVDDNATEVSAVARELAPLREELHERLHQEEAKRSSSLAELHSQAQQAVSLHAELLAAIKNEECGRMSAVTELKTQLQEVQANHSKEVVSLRDQFSTVSPRVDPDREVKEAESPKDAHPEQHLSASQPLAQQVSRLRAEIGALRAEHSFSAARAEGRHAALEAGLSDARRIVVTSSAQTTRRLDSFQAAAAVQQRTMDIVKETQLQRMTGDKGLSSAGDMSDRFHGLGPRLGSVEAVLHDVQDCVDRQSSRLGRSEEWLQSLVAKGGDAERRLQQLEKRLPKSLREAEEPLEDALAQLTTGVLKMAQLLGVASEDLCEKLGWRDACWDLPRMMDHAWLRSRLPKRASVLKILRQKADAEQVRQLQEQFEMCTSFSSGGENSFRGWNVCTGDDDPVPRRYVPAPPEKSKSPWTYTPSCSSEPGNSGETGGHPTISRVPGPRFGAGSTVFLSSHSAAATSKSRPRSAAFHRTAASQDSQDNSHGGKPIVPPSPQDDWAEVRRSCDEQTIAGSISTPWQPSPASGWSAESPRTRVGNTAPPRDAWGGMEAC